MGVNWIPGVNPESIPRLRFVPAIALPTVFGDALSYMEQVGKVNAAINGVIDNVNNLAADLVEQVAQSVENAKIPVYDKLVHNGSNIISQLNWNLENPAVIYNAIVAGKMCIVTADCDFNIDHIPVPSNRMKQMMVLTQAYVQNLNNYTTTIHTTFTNYTDNKIRYAQINITCENDVYTSELIAFTEYEIPTTLYVDNMHRFIDKKVMLYKGEVEIPSEDGSYIEIANNASTADLSSFFVVENTTAEVHAPETCPCVVIDVKNGRVGQFKYGGDVTPWARIYGTGLSVKSDTDAAITDIYNNFDQFDEVIDIMQHGISANTGSISSLDDRLGRTESDVEYLELTAVQTVIKEFTDAEKNIARTNIDSAKAHNPDLYGTISLIDEYGNSVEFLLDRSANINYIMIESGNPIIRGVRDPVNSNDVATKGYVDSIISDTSDCVKVTEQSFTETQKNIARGNIGALGYNNPYIYGGITMENNSQVLQLLVSTSDARRVLYLVTNSGNTIIRNVANPVLDSDAATKKYVDEKTIDSGSSVKYIGQNLTETQKATARNNIGAISVNHGTVFAPLHINEAGENDNKSFIRLDYDSGDDTVVAELKVDVVNENYGFYDLDNNIKNIKTGIGSNDDECVNVKQFNAKTSPIVIDVNTGNNSWTIRGSVLPSMTLEWIIGNWVGGKPVIVHYPVADELLVDGWFAPKCANIRYGLVGEGYDGTAWKRYTLNMDGTVTITSL